jgi:4-alpha-glucanotransferase
LLLNQRSAGILLHPTSLPGPFGIGDLGPVSHQFIDWLAESGCRLWQVLPLGPTGFGNSPYQCHSAFAGNPYLISPDLLVRDGLLASRDLVDRPNFDLHATRGARRIDFARLIPWKQKVLQLGFDRFQESAPETLRQDFAAFRAENASWLEDFSLYMALKEANGAKAWPQWAASLRNRDAAALSDVREALGRSITRFSFYQFLFFRQWGQLRDHARARGVRIIGDLPIFAAADSTDVWAYPELFLLDDEGAPTYWSGVPPDYFAATGQLWGNPLYRWDAHQRTGYEWWLRRVRATLGLVDIARLDHFRGFVAAWEILAGNPTAEFGRWAPGPADDLFDSIVRDLRADSSEDGLPLIAEDLGVITPDVIRLREKYALPGMRVLQFGFSEPQPLFLPHNYISGCVAYTGTHDNDTARGWLRSAPKDERAHALRYLRTSGQGFAWAMIHAIWASVAAFAIAPMQDLLDLGTRARMNYPGRLGGNWEWRMREDDLSDALASRIKDLNDLYGRR